MHAPATRVLPASPAALEEAARILRSGGLVAFPTETVYGLGADATNAAAIARLYAAKGRPVFNPLIAHVVDAVAARQLAAFNADAQKLADAFWPGPLTVVLPQQQGCPVADLATAGLDTIALRIPASPIAQSLLTAFGGPIVAPSANISGHVSPTLAAHVLADLDSRVDLILDGGSTEVGLESTIVACVGDGPILLRPGGLARGDIEAVLGHPLEAAKDIGTDTVPTAPGQLASHYAPQAKLRLVARDVKPGEALLAFGPISPRVDAETHPQLNLSPKGDLAEAAANLFSYLRRLDAAGPLTIAVMPIPHEGLGEAINDRLRRAAAPRM